MIRACVRRGELHRELAVAPEVPRVARGGADGAGEPLALVLVRRRRRRRIAQRLVHQRLRRAEVQLHLHLREREHVGDVVEAVAAVVDGKVVGRRARRREEVAHRGVVLGAVQPMERDAPRIQGIRRDGEGIRGRRGVGDGGGRERCRRRRAGVRRGARGRAHAADAAQRDASGEGERTHGITSIVARCTHGPSTSFGTPGAVNARRACRWRRGQVRGLRAVY